MIATFGELLLSFHLGLVIVVVLVDYREGRRQVREGRRELPVARLRRSR